MNDAVARRPLGTAALAGFAAATVIGAIGSAHHYNMMATNGHPMPWRHAAVMEMPYWYAAAVLMPPLVWALHRYPERTRGFPRIAQHAALALAWVLLQTVLEVATRRALGTGLPGPVPSLAQSVYDSLARDVVWKLLTYGAIVGAVYAITYHARYRERDLAASQLEARLVEAELRALRMQLNPHFLFNAMNTVAMLTRAGRSSESVAMLLELSALMRDALRGDAAECAPLEDELRLLRRYVAVEQVRFGGQLDFVLDVPPALAHATVPGFLLQPLVENAIRHGRAAADGAAHLGVRAERAEDQLILTVWDDGPGFEVSPRAAQGVGLRNVRERLRLIYGSAQSFDIGRRGARTVACISIPIRFASPEPIAAPA